MTTHPHEVTGTVGTAIDRRNFIGATAASLPLALLANVAAGVQAPVDGLIERSRTPPNLEFPFHTLSDFLVPTDRFFVRCHFPIPTIDSRSWRLRVDGAIARPLELTYDELRGMPARTVTAVLECAGNGRALNTPALRGVGWQLGAVSNAEWTGVPLSAVLDRAGIRPGAVEVVAEGADRGEISTDPRPAGAIAFARSLPIAKARQSEVLLAYRMNGADLTSAHGFPVRLLVPGWYGMASVKWLTRLVITETPFQGFWQTTDYSYYERINGLPVQRAITEMLVKSSIASPRNGEQVRAGSEVRISGAAWTGDSEISQVEVSTNGGSTWNRAQLIALPRNIPGRHTWRFWEYRWRVPAERGTIRLMSRATDARGRVQPSERDPDRRNYMVNHTIPLEVHVQ